MAYKYAQTLDKDGQFSETKQAKVHKAFDEMTEMLGGCIEFFDDTTQQKYAELGFHSPAVWSPKITVRCD